MSTEIKLNMVVTDGLRVGYVGSFVSPEKAYVLWDIREGNARTGGGGNIATRKLKQIGNMYNVTFYVQGMHSNGAETRIARYPIMKRLELTSEAIRTVCDGLINEFNAYDNWSDCTISHYKY